MNFIDPLVQGLEVYKISYKEQHFPYVSARLGGFVVVLGFYFLATQEPYDLLKSGYYNYLGNLEETRNESRIAEEYFEQASFLGYNTHHPNYQLAWKYLDRGNEYLAKTHFENAASKFPSSYASVNYSNLDVEINSAKVEAFLNRANNTFNDDEIKNNLGVLHLLNEEWNKALELFQSSSSKNEWNDAPLINKWYSLFRLNFVDSSKYEEEYTQGNFGVKSNILAHPTFSQLAFKPLGKGVPFLHQQAYLLNAAFVLPQDTLAKQALNLLETSTNANYNARLRKALAIYYYRNGFVNKAFRMLDYLQSNSYTSDRPGYLNDLGMLAFDQGSFELSNFYYKQAIAVGSREAEVNQLEVLAELGKADSIPIKLLTIVEMDPGLTRLANHLLAKLEESQFPSSNLTDPLLELEGLSDEALIIEASKNAFNEKQVKHALDLIQERGLSSEAYEVILEAIEINPYSYALKERYVWIALEQNLVSYAEEVLNQLEGMISPTRFQNLVESFERRKIEIQEEAW